MCSIVAPVLVLAIICIVATDVLAVGSGKPFSYIIII